MDKQPWFVQTTIACLMGLILLNLVMLASLLAGVEPHPPSVLGPLGGAGPLSREYFFVGGERPVLLVASPSWVHCFDRDCRSQPDNLWSP